MLFFKNELIGPDAANYERAFWDAVPPGRVVPMQAGQSRDDSVTILLRLDYNDHPVVDWPNREGNHHILPASEAGWPGLAEYARQYFLQAKSHPAKKAPSPLDRQLVPRRTIRKPVKRRATRKLTRSR